MKKLIYLFAITLFVFTSCAKEEDPPAPEQIVTQAPTVTTTTNNFLTGSGWNGQGTGLEIRNANNDVIFNNWIYSTPTSITLNLDETYNYIFKVGSAPQVNYTGTMTISASGLSYFNSPASALEIYYASGELTFWKQ